MDRIALIGAPIDSVGRGGGTELAPAALRALGIAAALGATDDGDLDVRLRGEERDPETGLLASADVLASTATIRAATAAALRDGRRPFIVGGCCAALPGALAGARDALGAVGLAHVDGHIDLYDGDTSPTGEAADMPISVALGLGPKAWVEAAGGAGTIAARTALIGFRDREDSIAHGMRQPEELSPPPLLYPATELRARDLPELGTELAIMLGGAAPFWLHLDVDVIDRAAFPATDYLMDGGLSWDELVALLRPLFAAPRLVGASLACYNPEKDPDRRCGQALVGTLEALLTP